MDICQYVKQSNGMVIVMRTLATFKALGSFNLHIGLSLSAGNSAAGSGLITPWKLDGGGVKELGGAWERYLVLLMPLSQLEGLLGFINC